MNRVLGSESLVGQTGSLKVETLLPQRSLSSTLIGLGNEIRIDVSNLNTTSVQLSGTWVGTVTFQCSINGAGFVPVQALPAAGGAIVNTATANGVWKIDTPAMKCVRVLFTAYTSGTCLVSFIGSVASSIQNIATSLAVTDAQLATLYGNANLYSPALSDAKQQIVAPIVNPTQPSSYVGNLFSRYPQKYRRVRVEVAGDEGIPIKQDPYTGNIIVDTPAIYSMLESLVYQQSLTNRLLAQAFNLPLPKDLKEDL